MDFMLPYILTLSIFCFQVCICDGRATNGVLICTNKTAPSSDREIFESNFASAMDSLSKLIANQRYGDRIEGNGNNTVYAFGECMKDLSQNDCTLCFAKIKVQILECRPFQKLTKGGSFFSDGCFIRYDDYDFFRDSLSSNDQTICGDQEFGGNQTLFKEDVLELVGDIDVKATENEGFYSGFVNRGNVSVYSLGQCWKFVRELDCYSCLRVAVSKIGLCPPKEEGRVLNAGCYLRFSPQKFYNSNLPEDEDEEQYHNLAFILASTFGAIAFLLVLATIFFLAKKKIVQRKKEKRLGAMFTVIKESKINFSYETLEKATDYFAASNKLGEGGSGCVYKGTLPDGQIVAVKRLLFNATQWVDHLFNEVNLISGIEHKNLVKLIGCSITGPESLLIYEYVPNHCLHDYIFGRNSLRPLTWEERFRIILGTAEGIAYLHNDSKLRIIHRDIKLRNILLEEDFTPKVADFDLARLFPQDKSHISTLLAGTLGYMAPEYITRGILTEKVDIYGFGVVVIEIVTARKNNAFTQDSYSILQKVWNLHRVGKLSEAVDPSLHGNFPEELASRVLQIALLCIQAAAEMRPSMLNVVKMLVENSEVPTPLQPPFLSCVSRPGPDSSPTNIHQGKENTALLKPPCKHEE